MRSSTSLRALCLVTTSFVAMSFVAISASFADAATITGTVTGPDGAPFRGAFVQARNAATKITVSVLSDTQGRYRVPDLPAGDYRLAIRAPGYRSDPKSGIKLTGEQNAAYDFGLQQGSVRWSDISLYQGFKLMPDAHGKELF
ncbi:MAG TPA: carboxypeptidase-like regulatory domain-containing protein, partial [Xanthobacteraceae bacterium]